MVFAEKIRPENLKCTVENIAMNEPARPSHVSRTVTPSVLTVPAVPYVPKHSMPFQIASRPHCSYFHLNFIKSKSN